MSSVEKPEQPSEKDRDKAIADSFPASDPPSGSSETGARAVPPETLLREEDGAVPDAVAISRRFPDLESAKLALEALIREGPVDRAATQLRRGGEGVEVVAAVPPREAERLRQLLLAP